MKSHISYLIIVGILFLNLNAGRTQTCYLSCNDHVHASLPSDNCFRSFDVEDFLQNPDPACSTYSLNIVHPYGTSQLDSNKVDASHLGYTIVFQVKMEAIVAGDMSLSRTKHHRNLSVKTALFHVFNLTKFQNSIRS